MWKDKIVTVGQLYALTSGNEILLECSRNGICCVCGVTTDKGLHILKDKVVSGSYGEYSDYAADSNIVCPVCRALFSNDNRQKKGVLMHYASSDDCSLRFVVGNEKSKTNPKYLSFSGALETVLKPPKGHFVVAFNRFGSNGTHFMPFAVVNYNPYGNCSKYYATVFTKVVMVDVKFLSGYVAKAMSLERKIWNNFEIAILLKYANGIDADRKKKLIKKIKTEKIPELLEFASIGLENIQRNAAGIFLVNSLFSAKPISKKQKPTSKKAGVVDAITGAA
jgi:hypothetical protein